ncbi:methylamine utilization protein [Marinobacter subterrani]|uniref:Plastocyanin n=1 Tax=Marinobacter subterrani TaxID=1658765 RepID=A0A0J7J371_9GAMM|nr:methylamine utilization protein [Marinobacter subterrani]KMQ72893.1 Plastocyanin [Marinobacter subterrani]
MQQSATTFIAGLLLCLAATATAATGLPVTVINSDNNKPVAGAVVWAGNPQAVAPVSAEIYQKDRAFHPRILVVPVGSSVDFPNRDNTQHHVYSFSPAKTFNIKLYAGRPEAPIIFDKPGIVELGCNIHDQMQGFVVVTDTPAVGRTNDAGQVTLDLKPQPGERRAVLKIWHPRLPDTTRPVIREVDASQPVTIALDVEPEPATDGSLDLLQQRFREL